MTSLPIKRPGRYMISGDAYHADPCIEPSLSRGVAVTLLDRSPRHAWMESPRLNPNYAPVYARHFDFGGAVHDLFLGEPDRFLVIKADSFKGDAARRKRDTARKMGLIPILAPDLERGKDVVRAARAQLSNHPEAGEAFLEGEGEVTLIWLETVTLDDGTKFKIWCRCRLDWDGGTPLFYDLKTTAISAHPETWGRLLFREGLDVQAAFYRRGITKVLKHAKSKVRFRFVVVEVEPPFALSVIELDPAAMDLAERKVEAAIKLWAECMKSGQWPGYPSRVAYVQAPVWNEKSWTDREDREYADRSEGRSQLEAMIRWQSPFTTDEASGRKVSTP